MRFVASPAAPEEQFVRNVKRWNVGDLLDILVRPSDCRWSVAYVAVCQDGRLSWNDVENEKYAKNLVDKLSSLFTFWGRPIEMRYLHFSFFDNAKAMMDVLLKADLFIFGGIFSPVSQKLRSALQPGEPRSDLEEKLIRRVRSGRCCYFGICGGAILGGARNHYNLRPFDFFDGVEINYEVGYQPSEVGVSTPEKFQLVHGCAFAISLQPEEGPHKAIAFPVIKNAWQWKEWAHANGNALQTALPIHQGKRVAVRQSDTMTTSSKKQKIYMGTVDNVVDLRRLLLQRFEQISPERATQIFNALFATLDEVNISRLLSSTITPNSINTLFRQGVDLLERNDDISALDALLETGKVLPPWPKDAEMKELDELLDTNGSGG